RKFEAEAARHRTCAALRIGQDEDADGHRLDTAAGSAAGHGPHGSERTAAAIRSGARTGAYSQARLFDQFAADRRRNHSLLSPGRVVGRPPDAHRAGKLLRRYGRGSVRRRHRVCPSTRTTRGIAACAAGARDGGHTGPTTPTLTPAWRAT